MSFVAKLLVLTLAVLATSYILPGILVESIIAALIAALVLGLINTFVKPVLVILTIPLTVVTLGIFLLILNALLLLLTSALVSGFHVSGFWWAVLGSIIISVINSAVTALVKNRS